MSREELSVAQLVAVQDARLAMEAAEERKQDAARAVERKNAALLAAVAAGVSETRLAEELGIHRSTFHHLKKKAGG